MSNISAIQKYHKSPKGKAVLKKAIGKYHQSPKGKAAIKKAKDKHTITRYGITIEEFNVMFENQGGCCAICGTHQSDLPNRLAIDHDHNQPLPEGIRGLLCPKCNTGLGLLGDSLESLTKALNYLKS